MATETIKGISVKIGADTSDFIKGLKKIDKEINYSEKQAKELQKQLQFEFDEKTFLTAQAKVRNDLEATEQKAKAIKQQLEYLENSGGIDSKGYKDLQVELEKNTTQAMKLNAELEKLDKIKFENAFKGIKTLSNNLETAAKKTVILSAAAVGAIAGINKLAKDAVATGDEIQTTADQYNLSAEAIQKWNYIALQSDVPAEQLYKSMTKARDAIGTALVGGTSTAKTALESLIGDLTKVPTDTEGAFNTVITALAGVEDSTMQAYYANEIFGERVATQLIPLLNQGADGLKELGKEFETVGYLSNEQVRALADYDNELNKLNTRLQNAKTELGIAMLPLMERFADILENVVVPAIKKLSDWFNDLSPSMQSIIAGGLLLFASLSPVLLILSKIIGVVPNLIKLLGSLKNATWQSYLGFTALAGAMALTFDLIGNWKQMSTVEKILKSLALAALVAASAVTVFHAAWSWGIAIGAITAGIVAGLAAINSAAKDIGIDADFGDESSIESYANGDYKIPTSNSGGNTYNEDNSQYNIDIKLNATGNLDYDAKTLADEVIKQIVVKKQSSGKY